MNKKSTKDSSLYGIPRPKKNSSKEISSSTSLAFSSQLSSLIATSSSSKPSESVQAGRSRPKKADIFSTHNKGSRKRALADLDDTDFTQRHSTSSDALDSATWARAKRKMEEKARLYSAMKRGDVEDVDEKHMVDFDRKWAEQQDARDADTSSDDGASSDDGDTELIEYVDEFGRTRKGTKAEAAREERRKKSVDQARAESDGFAARPSAPENIIYGDTIQAAAFNPDEPIAAQMAAIAAKRDREATPPEDVHFDGNQEIRTKGVGFFQFSADNETRKKEMENLEKERIETERARKEREDRKKERLKHLEERKKAINEKRGKVQAERFLDDLMGELGQKSSDTKESE